MTFSPWLTRRERGGVIHTDEATTITGGFRGRGRDKVLNVIVREIKYTHSPPNTLVDSRTANSDWRRKSITSIFDNSR